MGRGYERQLKKLLTEAGCRFVRPGRGDHEIWWSPITQQHFTVDRGVALRHTANGTLKDAGLEKAF